MATAYTAARDKGSINCTELMSWGDNQLGEQLDTQHPPVVAVADKHAVDKHAAVEVVPQGVPSLGHMIQEDMEVGRNLAVVLLAEHGEGGLQEDPCGRRRQSL